mmetsp:Transcript_54137/g.128613  ORF Transcript_54137/g.128613 Transcript_54137/m.128613 type:complete len:221 (+) Transcript_54137:1491-2153(+)
MTLTEPSLQGASPSSADSSVDLPAPTGPTTATRSPTSAVRSTPCSAAFPSSHSTRAPFSWTATPPTSAWSAGMRVRVSTMAGARRSPWRRLVAIEAPTYDISIHGNTASGNCRIEMSDSTGSATESVRTLPCEVYTAKIVSATIAGAEDQRTPWAAPSTPNRKSAFTSRARRSSTRFEAGPSHANSFRTRIPLRSSDTARTRSSLRDMFFSWIVRRSVMA